jgi:hypothetical protein
MQAFRFLFATAFLLLSVVAPALAQTSPNALGWTWWSTATADQKQSVVMGEIDSMPTGYTEAVILVAIVQALTGNDVAKKIYDNLQKTPPAFSKAPAQYVVAVDGVYAKPAARKLPLSYVMACLADTPFGASTVDGCITAFEH